MSSGTLSINGSVVVGNGVCGSCDDAGSSKTVGLGFQCPSLQFASILSSDSPIAFSSPLVFADLALLQGFSDIGFILMQTAGQELEVRINPLPAIVLTANSEPFAGLSGLDLVTAVDGQAAVTTTFSVATDAATLANEINAAAALLGQAPPATVVDGQIQISGVLTGPEGSVDIQSGTALTALGLSVGVTLGSGEDILSGEIWMQKFGLNSVQRIQFRGTASLSILAAGTPV